MTYNSNKPTNEEILHPYVKYTISAKGNSLDWYIFASKYRHKQSCVKLAKHTTFDIWHSKLRKKNEFRAGTTFDIRHSNVGKKKH